MRYLQIVLIFIISSCSDEPSFFTKKDHQVIKYEIAANYSKRKQTFDSLAKQVSSFKILRAVEFNSGRNGLSGIEVYCDSIDRNGKGYSFVIKSLDDSRLQNVLKQEGISRVSMEAIKQKLDRINCNSFFTLRTSSNNTGTPYVHIEFKYNDWNGANFYFYKLFDKKIEADMVHFFDRKDVVLGQIKSTGGILDSNAVWYLPTD